MPLKSRELVRRIADLDVGIQRLSGIIPKPPRLDLEEFRASGKAFVDLRLGRWLLSLRQSRATLLEVEERPERPPALPSAGALLLALDRHVRDLSDDRKKERWLGVLEEARARDIDFDELRHELEIDELSRGSSRPERLARYHLVPFGGRFILHPGEFLLGII